MLENDLRKAKEKAGDTSQNLTSWRQKVETALDFARAAQGTFIHGSRDDKRYVLMAVGSNLTLTNQKVRIDLLDHFKVFSEHENWNDKYKDSLEPQKYSDLLGKNVDLTPANPIWLPG